MTSNGGAERQVPATPKIPEGGRAIRQEASAPGDASGGTRVSDSPGVVSTEHLAWLLGCLDSAVECLDWCGRDVDARIVEAHRAELAAGREWPGNPVRCRPEFMDGPRAVV